MTRRIRFNRHYYIPSVRPALAFPLLAALNSLPFTSFTIIQITCYL
nr:MAG TPA: hypothetical protein [Caudoviricetes sp.]